MDRFFPAKSHAKKSVSNDQSIGQRIGPDAGVHRNHWSSSGAEKQHKAMDSDRVVTYRAGKCAVCESALQRGAHVQSVDMHVFGPIGTVVLRCWLCRTCRPNPATVKTTSALLADRVLGWYRANPSAWPVLHRSTDG